MPTVAFIQQVGKGLARTVVALCVAIATAACARPTASQSTTLRSDYSDLARFRVTPAAVDAGAEDGSKGTAWTRSAPELDSSAASRGQGGWSPNIEALDAEFRELQAALDIPGLAYVLVSKGRVVAARALGSARAPAPIPFRTSTPVNIASVTKTLTSAIAIQLSQEGRLDLDAPVSAYAPTLDVPAGVRVRHLLSHSSEGRIGAEFQYSSPRFALLRQVLEKAAGTSFEEAVRTRVLRRAGMREHESPRLGPHGGLVSTADDMGRYLVALENGLLLDTSGLARVERAARAPDGAELRTSLGWFVQEVQGQRVVWSFGQDAPDRSGSLLVRLPDRQVSLFLLANSHLVSDPFRLLMGDVRRSPFAMSFLRLFAFSPPGAPLGRPSRAASWTGRQLDLYERRSAYRFGDELIGWALVDLQASNLGGAVDKLALALGRRDGCAPDPVVHYATMRLQDPRLRERGLCIGRSLLATQPSNRRVLLTQGTLLQQAGREAEANAVFRRILGLSNQEPAGFGLVLSDLITGGIGGDLRVTARRMLDSLGAPPRP